MIRASAILVAAGTGSRLGLTTPKAFVKLGGHTLLYYSLRTLARLKGIDEAVIAIPERTRAAARSEVSKAGLEIPVKLTAGGAERQDSVRIALALTSAESELVIVHDAARPFASPAQFEACLDAAARADGAIVALPVADTLKRVGEGAITATIPRMDLYQAQTPQAFRRRLLIFAHERAERERIRATDDAELAEQMGARIEIVEGAALNFKITTPADLQLAQALARSLV